MNYVIVICVTIAIVVLRKWFDPKTWWTRELNNTEKDIEHWIGIRNEALNNNYTNGLYASEHELNRLRSKRNNLRRRLGLTDTGK